MLGFPLVQAPAHRPWWPANANFAIDFVTGIGMRDGVVKPISELMSFSRASTKFARNSSGIWQSFAVDQPAITDLGLSIEPARTNKILANTANSGAGYLMSDTIRSNLPAGESPALDNNGKLVTQGSAANAGLYFGPFAGLITAGSQHAISASFKYAGSARYLRIVLSDNISVVRECWLDLVEKVVGNANAGSTVKLTPMANGWMHLELVTGPFPSTTSNAQVVIVATEGMGNTARAAGSYKVWGGQLEHNVLSATSPLLTTGLEAVRAADEICFYLATGGQKLHLLLNNSWNHLITASGNDLVVPTSLPGDFIKRTWAEQHY